MTETPTDETPTTPHDKEALRAETLAAFIRLTPEAAQQIADAPQNFDD